MSSKVRPLMRRPKARSELARREDVVTVVAFRNLSVSFLSGSGCGVTVLVVKGGMTHT